MSKNGLYFDYNATTAVHPIVKAAFPNLLETYGNPSSLYETGRSAKAALETARDQVAHFIGAESDHVIFTSSGTESVNQVFRTILWRYLLEKEPQHVIISAIEHSCCRVPCDQLSQLGIAVTVVPVSSSGHVNPADVLDAIKPETSLISIMLANNEVGTIQPVQEIVNSVKDHPALVHTDAVQALGKIPVNVQALGVDFLSISGHKVYAPKGIGALYVKDMATLSPLLLGGSQEQKKRASTENVPGAMALGLALEKIPYFDYDQTLKANLISGVKQLPGSILHTPSNNSLWNTVCVGFEGVDGHALAMNLDLEGIAVSTGSACSTGSIDPSSVLTAMGVNDDINKASIRLSMGLKTTKEEIELLIQKLQGILGRLK